MDFVHLHNHSSYSLLDGFSSPELLANEAMRLGYKQLALTDHGTCAGLYNFQKSCHNVGIKPILGMEAYTCDNHKVKEKGSSIYHLVLLAKNQVGYQNLIRLSTESYMEGFYRKPRIDFDLLSKYSEGLIVSSACCIGEISRYIVNDDLQGAENLASKYKSLFGDDFYLEIMTHEYFNNNPQQKLERDLAVAIYKMSKRMGIKAICTNDTHYAKKQQWESQDILLSVQTGKCIKDPNRMTFNSHDFYLKPIIEMQQLYSNAPELLKNTMEIAEKIENEDLITAGIDLLPILERPAEYKDDNEWLKALVTDGMKKKGFIGKKEYRERIKYEMSVIINCGYVKYFLVLFDLINFAQNQGIRVGIGRGCFLPSNKVKTIDGESPICDIKKGDEVLSYDGEYHDVIDTMVYDVNEDIIEIEVDDGRSFSCTLDHKIHVIRNGTLEWVEAQNLTEDDNIYDINNKNDINSKAQKFKKKVESWQK